MRHALQIAAATVMIAACSSTDAAPVANLATAAQDGHASHSAANNGELTAAQLLAQYSAMLYRRLGSYAAVAKRTALDPIMLDSHTRPLWSTVIP